MKQFVFISLLLPSLLWAQSTPHSSALPQESIQPRDEWVHRLPLAQELSRPQDRRLLGLLTLNGFYSNQNSLGKDSSTQSSESIYAKEAILAVRPMWQDKAEGGDFWLYYTRVLKQKPTRPLYQLICHFQPLRGDTFAVKTYVLNTRAYLSRPQLYQTWMDEHPFEGLGLEDLDYLEGCDILFYYDQALGQYTMRQEQAFCRMAQSNGLAYYQFFQILVDAHSLHVGKELYNERKELVSPEEFRYYERMKPQAVQELLWELKPKADKPQVESKKTAQNLEFKRN